MNALVLSQKLMSLQNELGSELSMASEVTSRKLSLDKKSIWLVTAVVMIESVSNFETIILNSVSDI